MASSGTKKVAMSLSSVGEDDDIEWDKIYFYFALTVASRHSLAGSAPRRMFAVGTAERT